MTPAWGDYVGTLPAAEVDPFFRPPETSTRKGKKMKRQADDNYVAMSYWWGPKDEEPTAEIVVNGRIVKVRENLEAGLRQFREMEYFQQGGKIWIDSLCINQQDEAEKQDQVQMMASIYRCAGNVMVWLGPADIESGCSITFLENAGADFRAEYVEAFDGADPITAHTWRTMALVRMETSYNRFSDELRTEPTRLLDPRQELLDDVAFAFHSFFARPYWRRLWIIQELCMGRGGMPIVCGDRVTQWRYIRDGVLKFMSILDILDERRRGSSSLDKRASLQESLSHVAQIAQLEIMGHRRKIQHVDDNRLPLIAPTWLEHGPLLGSALRRAVVLASRTDCSRSHDRIYGMLSIPAIPDLGIKVDYTKPLADVFTEFSAACVKHGSLDFFAILDGGRMSLTDEHGNPQDPDKPSWVPDYGAKPERRIGILDGVWHAGGYVPVSFAQPVVGPQNFLCCQGKVVDTVDGTGAISQADVESGAMIFKPEDDLLSLQQPTVPDSESENQNPQLRGEAVIYNVLVGGCDRNGMEAPASFKCLYTAFPPEEPFKCSAFYRNWQFLNSTADLMVHGKPLSSYFDSASTPAYTMSGASETAAARQAMEMRTKMRRLIVTKAGYLGLAPVQTRPGDVVIDIVGHPTPLIARKDGTMDGQDFWYLIGEAYIAGLMGAEKMPLSTKHWHQKETRRAMAEMDIIIFV
ncbi:HET-domain-containing protein [Canariomyces notabilis]|uniref:HET-domain-containing protein n=1 Tax=Canariomyces notabilis TaxID=2074819 RepID=A0AAN6QJD9_9PEZI|nr:HET-domain-containing protein [Canariomyces arenarius]